MLRNFLHEFIDHAVDSDEPCMNVTTRCFRTARFGDSFTFEFHKHPDGRVDIRCTEHPPCHYDATPARCHLGLTGNVDVGKGIEPRTFDCALVMAIVWAERYSHYCRTGVFPTSHGQGSMQQPSDR